MAIKLKWPWLGVAIPSFLIAFIGYNAHYFILSRFVPIKSQLIFQSLLTMTWVSYGLAIFKNPGRPPKDLNVKVTPDVKYCDKCRTYKPPRAHHCKTCRQCVLMMDHHCPWILNCVGYENFIYFMRFLFWVIVTTAYLLYWLLKRICTVWKMRNSHQAIFTRIELLFLTILTPLDVFVLVTIVLLLLRCLFNQIVSGRTQIETWEMERLESLFFSKRLLNIMIPNLWSTYPNEKTPDHEEEAKKLIEKQNRRRLRFESVVNFPYDRGLFSNAVDVMGNPLLWIWPFSGPSGDGIHYETNDIALYEPGSSVQDLLLSLTWPPDGGRRKAEEDTSTTVDSVFEGGEQVVRKRTSPLKRTAWENDWGETLEGFGVDIEVE